MATGQKIGAEKRNLNLIQNKRLNQILIVVLCVLSSFSPAKNNYSIQSGGAQPSDKVLRQMLWDFEKDPPGELPKGWSDVVGDWSVIPDPSAPTLPNCFGLSPGRFFTSLLRLNRYYPLAIAQDPPNVRNFSLEAWFETLGGRLDCSGGLVFSYQGPNSYLLMVAGCPTDRVSLATMHRGRLEDIADTVVPIVPGVWYLLKVVVVGERITCLVNGRVVLRISDSRVRPGKVGVWAHADAAVRFDDVRLLVMK